MEWKGFCKNFESRYKVWILAVKGDVEIFRFFRSICSLVVFGDVEIVKE